MKRLTFLVALLAGLLTVAAPAAAQPTTYPDVIPLPDGFFPEGIAVGTGHDAYAGSLANGAIWKVDLRSGAGDLLVPGTDGGIAVGLAFDDRSGALFVAGGPTGTATVYDGDTGATVAQVDLGAGFINDVIVTRTAAYFTNSFAPEFYEIPLNSQGEVDGPVRTIPLSGDFTFVPGGFNANGIEATPDGGTLILAGSAASELYTLDPATGVATVIDLDVAVTGDGLVLLGRTLYVNENSLNRIAVIDLSADLSSGMVVDYLTSDAYDVPTTSALFGSSLYAVNAKFGTPATPTTPYEIVRVDRN
jgi:sugar lactone lactonase YvrE